MTERTVDTVTKPPRPNLRCKHCGFETFKRWQALSHEARTGHVMRSVDRAR